MRPSRSGKRRAVILIAVQLLIIAHIIQWLITGTTTTPIEPSEGKDFGMYGVVNAGLVFFCLALLATLVLGRWFCGWGCHIVMVQDFCGWIMKKAGVRPRLFRSRLLMWVPLILGVYMFLWPAVYRLGVVPLDDRLHTAYGDDHWLVSTMRGTAAFLDIPLGAEPLQWRVQTHFTTTNFWDTFPGVMVAVPFLLICGFATVYFLGAKGFCTYGCPYGGFFAPLDRFAVGRIRVTDACEHCGHCTAVCTSNVRVHEEVREYGMVVNPGCMKCMDCVSVCPNDALYFGFGKPSLLAGAAKHETPKQHWDLTWNNEIACALLFVGTIFALRGVYNAVPMLMAGGAAGVITFMAWKSWRVLRDDNASFHHLRLKLKGAVQPVGWAFIAFACVLLLFTTHSGAVQGLAFAARKYDQQIIVNLGSVFTQAPMQLSEPQAAQRDRAIALYRLSSSVADGGVAMASDPAVLRRLAILHALKLEFTEAERYIRMTIAAARRPELFDLRFLRDALMMQERAQEAVGVFEDAVTAHPDSPDFADDLANIYAMDGRVPDAILVCRIALADNPDNLQLLRRLSVLELSAGNNEEAIRLIRQTIDLDPSNPGAYFFLSRGLQASSRMEEAAAALQDMVRIAPDNPNGHHELALVLEQLGRTPQAAEHMEIAQRLIEEQNSGRESSGEHQHH